MKITSELAHDTGQKTDIGLRRLSTRIVVALGLVLGLVIGMSGCGTTPSTNIPPSTSIASAPSDSTELFPTPQPATSQAQIIESMSQCEVTRDDGRAQFTSGFCQQVEKTLLYFAFLEDESRTDEITAAVPDIVTTIAQWEDPVGELVFYHAGSALTSDYELIVNYMKASDVERGLVQYQEKNQSSCQSNGYFGADLQKYVEENDYCGLSDDKGWHLCPMTLPNLIQPLPSVDLPPSLSTTSGNAVSVSTSPGYCYWLAFDAGLGTDSEDIKRMDQSALYEPLFGRDVLNLLRDDGSGDVESFPLN